MNLLERSELMAKDLVEIRRDLHQHPELSFQEARTASVAAREMEILGLKLNSLVKSILM